MRSGRIFNRLGKNEEEQEKNVIIQSWRIHMIHTCAVKISGWCVRCLGNSEEERQVIQYGIEVILDAVGKTAAILLAGALMGRAPAFAASLVFFCSLRYWAGGIHCKTSFRCLIAMLAICLISVYGAFWLENSGEGLFWAIAAFCYACMLFLAPGETGKSEFLDLKARRQKKLGSVLWMTGELILIAIINHSWWRWVLFLPMFIETISIIPCEMRKERGHEEHKSSKSDQETG